MSNRKLYVLLSRTGDLINLLPLALCQSKAQPVAIMASAEFAVVLDGCSYIKKLVFDGGMNELPRAVEQARKLSSDVTVCQLVGDDEVIKKFAFEPAGGAFSMTDSWAKEAWRIAGKLDLWKLQPPLVFDQRSKEREAALLAKLDAKVNEAQLFDSKNRKKSTKRLILVAVDGMTSPFKHKALLIELLKLKFWRTHHVIDLADFKCERIYDLLALYELASVLVAADSAPLHLAWAVRKLPVVALINDRPTPWNGSPWRPTHICHIRYSDFMERALDILDAIHGIGGLGCPFTPRDARNSRRIVHAWSRYEETEQNKARRESARQTWQAAYKTEDWISCPVEVGAVVKDSANMVKDELRYPLVKDVLRLACLRADDDDVICLTRADTCLPDGVTKTILGQVPSFSRRKDSPAFDLFAFTKAWWRANQNDLPDMLLGKDIWWHRVMMEFIKSKGGKELPFEVFQSE